MLEGTITMGKATLWIVVFIVWMVYTEWVYKQIKNRRKQKMVEWHITVIDGGQPLYNFIKELPENVLPPSYVNSINSVGFIPMVGEFERVRVNETETYAHYEKTTFFGGK